MQNNYNGRSDTQENNENIEQVSADTFGFRQAGDEPADMNPVDKNPYDESDDDDEYEYTGNTKGGAEKVSFADLRHGKKIPRLKKSMVLTIMVGGIFVFLITVNLIMQKREEQRKYFDEQKNNVETGNEFSLGDLERKPRQVEKVEVTEEEPFLKQPPAYAPLPPQKVVATGNSMAQPAPRQSIAPYSDSDLMAMRAQIGKEGGYGYSARTVSYNSSVPVVAEPAGFYNQPGMMGQIPSREEYTRQRLEEIAIAQAIGTGAGAQGRDNTRFTDAGKYNPNNPPQGGSLFYLNDDCLFPGTIIHAILISRIDTDYPGPIHARITENVYDSMTGKNLLIPQGTILQGNYSSSSIGVSKVQIAWESMVVSYGDVAYQVPLGGMAGVDKRGRTGIAGTLDDHYFEWLKAAGIISLFTMLNSEVMYYTQGQTSPQLRELMDINHGVVNRIGDMLIERALNIQPTVRVANGTAVSVSVNTIVNLRPFPAIKAEEKWIRR